MPLINLDEIRPNSSPPTDDFRPPAAVKANGRFRTRSIVHLELHTRDESSARDYYQQLCGWPSERIEAGNGSYLALAFGNGLGGGIVECGTQRALWLPYVGVERIDQATERAQDLGADRAPAAARGPGGVAQRRALPERGRSRPLAAEALAAKRPQAP